MTIAVRIVATVIATAACLPAFAQKEPPRDSGGVVMDLSAWHAIEPHAFMLNVGDLPDVALSRAERRVRDQRAYQERLWFDYSGSWMFVEHFPVALYNTHVTDKMQSGEGLERFAASFWRRREEPFATEEKRKIYSYGERAGWVHATRGEASGQVCFFARIGFLSDQSKTARRTEEHYDTSVSYRDCSGERDLDAVVKWLDGARIVSSTLNGVR